MVAFSPLCRGFCRTVPPPVQVQLRCSIDSRITLVAGSFQLQVSDSVQGGPCVPVLPDTVSTTCQIEIVALPTPAYPVGYQNGDIYHNKKSCLGLMCTSDGSILFHTSPHSSLFSLSYFNARQTSYCQSVQVCGWLAGSLLHLHIFLHFIGSHRRSVVSVIRNSSFGSTVSRVLHS